MIKPKLKTRKCADPDCPEEFLQRSSLQKYCSPICFHKNQKPKEPKQTSDFDLVFEKNRDEMKLAQIKQKGFCYCEMPGCGVIDNVDAHHIIFRSEKPKHDHLHDKKNLILVCRRHHGWFHLKKGNRNDLVKQRELHLIFGDDVLDK